MGNRENTILSCLADYADRIPDHYCIADKTGNYTYREVWSSARRYASYLRWIGVRSGDRVMAMCTQDHRFLLADFACGLLNAVFVPVGHKAGANQITNIMNEINAKVFLIESESDRNGNNCILFDDIKSQEVGSEAAEIFFRRWKIELSLVMRPCSCPERLVKIL